MSDPTMPAGLAALLQEPGWSNTATGNWYRRYPGIGLVITLYRTPNGLVPSLTETYSVEAMIKGPQEIKRIEAALAQEGTAE